MKKMKMAVLLCVAATAVVSAAWINDSVKQEGKGVIIADLNTSVKPGDNFYEFGCGGWIKANPIPGDESRWGTFNQLAANNKENLHKICESAANSKVAYEKGSPMQLVADFYFSAMDTMTIEKLGYQPIMPELKKIESITDMKSLLAEVAYLHRLNVGGMFTFYAYQDPKNSEVVVPQIMQGGLSLPDKDYYLKDDARSTKIRAAYIDHVKKMFMLTGSNEKDAAANADAILKLETSLAKVCMSRVELRDPFKTYNKVMVADLNTLTPSIDWRVMLPDMGATKGFTYLVLGQPDFLKGLEEQLKATSIADWKTYLKWRVISDAANVLSKDFVTENFNFFNKTLSGQKEMKPRWKRMVDMTDGAIGDALGQTYVAKYFPPEAKKKADELVSNLMAEYSNRIKNLDWMSDVTKEKAQKKLSTIIRKIGYPDKWKNYDGLKIDRMNFYQNAVNATLWEYDYMMAKIGQPVDKKEWGMTPPTVNAYYNPSINEIVFPAGILQPPFFNAEADDAVNYGGIGAVIGHEMTHGFDDEGRNYDANGNLNNWWTSEDSARFEEKANKLVQQYNGFTVLDTLHVNGELTLGENIADLGGITIAYHAFMNTAQAKEGKKIDGYTPEQRFFLGFARIWAGSILPEAAAQRIIVDPHSPALYRVNGSLSNLIEFYKAFGVSSEDKLFRPESERAKIW